MGGQCPQTTRSANHTVGKAHGRQTTRSANPALVPQGVPVGHRCASRAVTISIPVAFKAGKEIKRRILGAESFACFFGQRGCGNRGQRGFPPPSDCRGRLFRKTPPSRHPWWTITIVTIVPVVSTALPSARNLSKSVDLAQVRPFKPWAIARRTPNGHFNDFNRSDNRRSKWTAAHDTWGTGDACAQFSKRKLAAHALRLWPGGNFHHGLPGRRGRSDASQCVLDD